MMSITQTFPEGRTLTQIARLPHITGKAVHKYIIDVTGARPVAFNTRLMGTLSKRAETMPLIACILSSFNSIQLSPKAKPRSSQLTRRRYG